MKTHLKVEFTLDEQTADLFTGLRDPEACLQQLLRDALGEFISQRTPVKEYVLRRYSTQSFVFMGKKALDVQERVTLAEGFKVADLRLVDLDEG